MGSLIKAGIVTTGKHSGEYLVDCDPTAIATSAEGPENEAKSLVEQASLEAQAIIAEASRQAESIRAQAYEEGAQAARAELEADIERAVALATQLQSDVDRQLEEFFTRAEPEILKLSLEIAKKVTRHEISENSEFVLTTIKAGLQQLRDRQELKIRVNPADYGLVREKKEEIMSSIDGVRSVEVIEDRRIDEGGCVIESPNGDLDARISTQLKTIETALKEAA